jgi:putative two-component system response regulator
MTQESTARGIDRDPLQGEAPVASSIPHSDQCGGILVVDDTPSALHLMVELLTAAGYRVRPAPSGELALRSAFHDPPELVLLDVQMPGIDGFEVCTRLKADPRTAGVPVIFLSALNDSDSKVHGLDVGALDFISKPLQGEEVLARTRPPGAA